MYNQVNSVVDSFVLYGNKYKDIRQAVALSLCGSDVDNLEKAVKVCVYTKIIISSCIKCGQCVSV